jgi:hypothetical protein
MRNTRRLMVAVVAVLGVMAFMVPAFIVNAAGSVDTVSVSIKDEQNAIVFPQSDFTARINITNVSQLAGYDLYLSYADPVLEVQNVTVGHIGSKDMPINKWGFVPPGTPGTIRVFGNFYPPESVTGSGYLIEVHFHVIGYLGDFSDITLSNVELIDANLEDIIPGTIINGSVQILSLGPTIIGVNSGKEDGIYTTGEVLDFDISYSDDVTVNTSGGTPSLGLNSGGNAIYNSGSGTSTLTFRYTVATGQNTSDLDYVTRTSLILNGGTIRDVALNYADNTLPIVGTFAGAHEIVIDTPSVLKSVITTKANGIYGVGHIIAIIVTYNEDVFVNATGGTPTLELNSGGVAVYNSGSGTTALTFRYIIGMGQNTPDLDYLSTNSLSLNGGTITDITLNDTDNTLPVVGTFAAAHDIVIDTIMPSVTLSSPTPATTNILPIPITVTFSKSVIGFTVAEIRVSNGTVSNFYGSGAVYSFDITSVGQGEVSVNIEAGVAEDEAGNGNLAAVQLTRVYDSITPVITTVNTAKADGIYTTGEVIDIAVNYSEIVNVNTGGGIPALVLNSGGNAIYNSGSGTATLIFRYTIAVGQNSADLDYVTTGSLVLNGGTIRDTALNYAINTLPSVGTFAGTHEIMIDTAPMVTGVNTTKANGICNMGEVIDITVTYSESVDVNIGGGIPILVLNSGGNAVYNGGSGTSTLIFRYTVGAGQNSADLDYVTTGSLLLNGGTIRDARSNYANNTLPVAGTFAGAHEIVIDTLAPTVMITSVAPELTNGLPIPVTVIFSEDVSGFVIGDVTITNGVGGVVTGGWKVYTFNVIPTRQGLVTVGINWGVAQDKAGNWNEAAVPLSRIYDTGPPVVVGVNTTKPDGVYKIGEVIDITVTYDEDVTVNTAGGTPSLGLNSLGKAIYSGGSGTSTLTFWYIVEAGQNTEDLDYLNTNALSLIGGTIRDIVGNDVDNTLPVVGTFAAGHAIIIDTRGDVDGDGKVGIGDLLRIELIMLGQAEITPGADVDGDGKVGIGDILQIELKMLGLT